MIAMNMPTKADRVICLRRRISALINVYPEIVGREANCLLEYPWFEFDDLNLTFPEIITAFTAAVRLWKLQHKEKP